MSVPAVEGHSAELLEAAAVEEDHWGGLERDYDQAEEVEEEVVRRYLNDNFN